MSMYRHEDLAERIAAENLKQFDGVPYGMDVVSKLSIAKSNLAIAEAINNLARAVASQ